MKPILTICAAILIAAIAVFTWKLGSRQNHFGNPFTGLPVATIPDIVAKPDAFLGKPVRIQGKLMRQCPSTGCWFYLVEPGDSRAQELKVEMGDTTPRLPVRIGRLVDVEGQLIKFGEGYEFIGVAVTFKEEERKP